MTDDTFTLDITVLNGNGIFSLSYYANELDEYADFRDSIDHWTEDIRPRSAEKQPSPEPAPIHDALDEWRDACQRNENADYDVWDFEYLSHKMHQKVGEVDIDAAGHVQDVRVIEDPHPDEDERRER